MKKLQEIEGDGKEGVVKCFQLHWYLWSAHLPQQRGSKIDDRNVTRVQREGEHPHAHHGEGIDGQRSLPVGHINVGLV